METWHRAGPRSGASGPNVCQRYSSPSLYEKATPCSIDFEINQRIRISTLLFYLVVTVLLTPECLSRYPFGGSEQTLLVVVQSAILLHVGTDVRRNRRGGRKTYSAGNRINTATIVGGEGSARISEDDWTPKQDLHGKRNKLSSDGCLFDG